MTKKELQIFKLEIGIHRVGLSVFFFIIYSEKNYLLYSFKLECYLFILSASNFIENILAGNKKVVTNSII